VSSAVGVVTLTDPPDQVNFEGDSVTVTLQGSDTISGHTLSYSASGLPGGLSVNSSTGVISGTVRKEKGTAWNGINLIRISLPLRSFQSFACGWPLSRAGRA